VLSFRDSRRLLSPLKCKSNIPVWASWLPCSPHLSWNTKIINYTSILELRLNSHSISSSSLLIKVSNKLYLNSLYQFITVKSLTIWSNLRTIFLKIQAPLIRFRNLWRNMRGHRLKNANNKVLLKKQSQHKQSNNTKQSRVIYSISFCEMIRDPRHSSSRAKRQEIKWYYPKVLFNRSQSKIQLVRMHPSTMLRIRT
jgi:hypothetical protein